MRSHCHILLAAGILTGQAFGADGVPLAAISALINRQHAPRKPADEIAIGPDDRVTILPAVAGG